MPKSADPFPLYARKSTVTFLPYSSTTTGGGRPREAGVGPVAIGGGNPMNLHKLLTCLLLFAFLGLLALGGPAAAAGPQMDPNGLHATGEAGPRMDPNG